MKWGVYQIRDNDGKLQEIHIIPCDDNGIILLTHVLDFSCPCISRVEQPGEGCPPIIIHEMMQ